jgi:DNA replication protein DnaC
MTRRTSSRGGSGEDPLLARLREAFDILRLPKALESFEELLSSPGPERSRVEWLWALLEPQVTARVESRIERRIRESRLPERKTLASFEFDFQKKLDKDLVLELGTLAFLDKGMNILLAGWSGTGKSHIAKALALAACVQNRRVRYTTSEKMLAMLNASLADETLEKEVKQFTRPGLLVIDEVGLEQVERTVASRSGLMQKVLIPRYDRHLSTIITSNIDWKDWGEYLGDHLGAAAILDRLIHRSHVIVIEGPSYRDHEHKKNQRSPKKASVPRKRTAKKKEPPPSE